MTKKQEFNDSLTNLVSGLGTAKAKTTHASYVPTSIGAKKAEMAYLGSWICKKVVDVPAEDATRQWRKWDAKTKEAAAIENELKVKKKTTEALKASRLYGGAALFLNTGTKTTQNPLHESEVIEELIVLTSQNLRWPRESKDILNCDCVEGDFMVNGQVVHPSRLCLFEGEKLPGKHGWGDSVLSAPYDALIAADQIFHTIVELVNEAKIDIYKIKGLMANLGDEDFVNKMITRFTLANRAKSTVNALLLDSTEEFEQKKFGFSDLSGLIETGYMVAAAASNIPEARLIGKSTSGLSTSTSVDMRTYYDTISSIQSEVIHEGLSKLDDYIARKLGLEEASYTWESLWILTQAEISEKRRSETEYYDKVLVIVDKLKQQGLQKEADLTSLLLDIFEKIKE